MCVKGWKGKTKWNPAGIEVITQGKYPGLKGKDDADLRKEYRHTPEGLDLRGGAQT